MAIAQVGDRVGAISHIDKDTVYLFGYGIYEGLFEPPVGPFGITREQWDEMAREEGMEPVPFPPNPRIKLDNGKTVWGLECYWGPEDAVKAKIGDRKIVMVEPNFDHSNDESQHEEATANEESSQAAN